MAGGSGDQDPGFLTSDASDSGSSRGSEVRRRIFERTVAGWKVAVDLWLWEAKEVTVVVLPGEPWSIRDLTTEEASLLSVHLSDACDAAREAAATLAAGEVS